MNLQVNRRRPRLKPSGKNASRNNLRLLLSLDGPAQIRDWGTPGPGTCRTLVPCNQPKKKRGLRPKPGLALEKVPTGLLPVWRRNNRNMVPSGFYRCGDQLTTRYQPGFYRRGDREHEDSVPTGLLPMWQGLREQDTNRASAGVVTRL
jgi:hypothetical protein